MHEYVFVYNDAESSGRSIDIIIDIVKVTEGKLC